MESTKQKFVVFKKVFANEIYVVEAESQSHAINEVCEGNGLPMRTMHLEWQGDLPPNFWHAEPISATDEELQALRRSATDLPDMGKFDSFLGDME